MAISSFINFLSSITDLSSGLLAELESSAKVEIYQQHRVFHGAGQVETRLWFLSQGLIRSYYFDRHGKEHTLHFYMGDEMIFSWQGIYGEPADFYLEALETSRLVSLNYTTFDDLYMRFPEVRLIAGVLARRRSHQDLFYSRLMTWSADERYRQFRKFNPLIFRKTSIRLIATYLNMTRENLSKLITHDNR